MNNEEIDYTKILKESISGFNMTINSNSHIITSSHILNLLSAFEKNPDFILDNNLLPGEDGILALVSGLYPRLDDSVIKKILSYPWVDSKNIELNSNNKNLLSVYCADQKDDLIELALSRGADYRAQSLSPSLRPIHRYIAAMTVDKLTSPTFQKLYDLSGIKNDPLALKSLLSEQIDLCSYKLHQIEIMDYVIHSSQIDINNVKVIHDRHSLKPRDVSFMSKIIGSNNTALMKHFLSKCTMSAPVLRSINTGLNAINRLKNTSHLLEQKALLTKYRDIVQEKIELSNNIAKNRINSKIEKSSKLNKI